MLDERGTGQTDVRKNSKGNWGGGKNESNVLELDAEKTIQASAPGEGKDRVKGQGENPSRKKKPIVESLTPSSEQSGKLLPWGYDDSRTGRMRKKRKEIFFALQEESGVKQCICVWGEIINQRYLWEVDYLVFQRGKASGRNATVLLERTN